MDLYRELILDHYKNPRNFGHLEKPDAVMEENNVSCGDKIIMEIHFGEKKGKKIIRDVRFSGVGCAISQASASLLTEKVLGMPITDAMELTTGDILELLGTTLTPSRIKCATLGLEVLHKTILSGKGS